MASRAETSDLEDLFRLLVAYRLFVYLGGLIAIGAPLVVQRVFEIEVSPTARWVIVVVSLGLMVLTYVGERRVGHGHVDERTGEPKEPYSLRTRLTLVGSIVGIAVGIYAAVEVNLLVGGLFVLGSVMFGRVVYRNRRREEGLEDR